MKAWWLKLSPRERTFVAAGGGVIAVLAILQLVLAPVLAWRSSAAQRAETAESDYRLVYRSAALAEPAKPAAAGEDRSVRTVLTELASQSGVALTFVNALADGSVEIQGGPASPDDMFAFLSALETRHGVRVIAADIVRASDDPARVRIQATLSR